MHPPPFHPEHRLSDWPECRLEVRCRCSQRVGGAAGAAAGGAAGRPAGAGRGGGVAVLGVPGQGGSGVSGGVAEPERHARAAAELVAGAGAGSPLRSAAGTRKLVPG